MPDATKDLLVLVADADMRSTLVGLLGRPQSFSIRQVVFDIRVNAQHDAGCRGQGDIFLRQFQSQYNHALIMFDREGCGQENKTRIELETDMEKRLAVSGWGDRAACVVLDPELESWVWSNSPHVTRILGWTDRENELKEHLTRKSYFIDQQPKPTRPKEAMREALKAKRIPPSASLFQQLAEKVSFSRCSEPSFLKFKSTLQGWFTPV